MPIDTIEVDGITLTLDQARTVRAKLNASERETHGGPPRKPKRCPHCRATMGTRELIQHRPRCNKNPRNQPH